MLTYDMNKRGNRKKYIYLYECIRTDIITGKLHPDEKLPSKRALSEHLNISIVSVMNAYDQLMLEGFIYSEQRKGYFVQKLEFVSSNIRPYKSVQREFQQNTESSFDLSEKKDARESASDAKATFNEKRESPAAAKEDSLIDSKANRTSLSLFPLGVWKKYMRQALSVDSDSLLKPVPFNGLRELRTSLSVLLMNRKGMKVDPEQIIIGCGTEYLYSKLLQLLNNDKILALENPGYMKLSKIAQNYGWKSTFIDLDDNGMKITDLEKSGADIVHVSPANNFPTGMIMPIKRRLELLNWAASGEGRYIIEDDYDSEFRYSGKHILPIYAEDAHGKVIYMNTFSKTLVPSIRISYMILPYELLERYEKNLSFYACTVSSFEQYALSLFIDNGNFDRHLNRLKKYYREQRKLFLDELKNSRLEKNIEIYERNSGTHLLICVKNGISEEELYERGIRENIILSFLSEYTHGNLKHNTKAVIVFNYASIEKEKIPDVVLKLERIILRK